MTKPKIIFHGKIRWNNNHEIFFIAILFSLRAVYSSVSWVKRVRSKGILKLKDGGTRKENYHYELVGTKRQKQDKYYFSNVAEAFYKSRRSKGQSTSSLITQERWTQRSCSSKLPMDHFQGLRGCFLCEQHMDRFGMGQAMLLLALLSKNSVVAVTETEERNWGQEPAPSSQESRTVPSDLINAFKEDPKLRLWKTNKKKCLLL